MKWKDERILVNDTLSNLTQGSDDAAGLESTIVDAEILKNFWTPDVWIENLREFELIKSYEDQTSLQIQDDKNIIFWQRF